jgi:hypothetical protein
VNLGYYELERHKPCLEEDCSELFVEKKQAKVHWVQNPSEMNVDNMSNARRETSGNSGIKRVNTSYLKKQI